MKLKVDEAYCYVCNETKNRQNSFLKIYNPHAIRRVTPICTECLSKIYSEYYSKFNRPDSAMWCICADIGVPFKYDVWNKLVADYEQRRETNKSDNPVSKYLELLGDNYDGFWQSDRMLDSFQKISKDEKIETEQELLDRRKRQVKDWGYFQDEDLDYLDFVYKDYTENIGKLDKITINRYRDLCKAELLKRKADISGDAGEIDKARKNVTEMLKLLHLDNFKGNERDDKDKRLDRIIWNIENTKPCECEDLDKYRDFSGMSKTWEHIMRCVQNLCAGTKNYPKIPKNEK